MNPGADLEKEANHSSGSLKQGVWQPPRSYRIFCFMEVQKCHLMQDLARVFNSNLKVL